jgi:putative peptidoglycan lipid II flippase
VQLAASNAYDPNGDGREHDEEVANATDGNPQTFWETERYDNVDFGNLKDGVGIVFDAGRPVKLRSLTVVSDTPGYVAKVEAGASSDGPFASVSPSQTVGARTTFALSVDPARRYYLLWITRLASGYPRSHVNEVTAR